MTNINKTQFTLSGMTRRRKLADRAEERFFNVKENGAVGDGIANDTAAIQTTLDKAYSTESNPHGSEYFGGDPAFGGDTKDGWTNRDRCSFSSRRIQT